MEFFQTNYKSLPFKTYQIMYIFLIDVNFNMPSYGKSESQLLYLKKMRIFGLGEKPGRKGKGAPKGRSGHYFYLSV